MKRVLGEVTEQIQRILQREKRRLLKKFYLTVVHADAMDSLLFEKYLKKKGKLSPDTQSSSKSPRTLRKEKAISYTERRIGASRNRKKEHVRIKESKQRKLSEKN